MNSRRNLYLLFSAALVFRLLHFIIFANDVVPGSDQMQVILLGNKFASGDLYGVLDTYWAPFYPVLIGIVSIFIHPPVIPTVVVSLVASSLIVPLTYVFVEQSYGGRTALIAGVIALFFPHFINAAIALGSENVFIALILGVLILSWNAMETGSKLHYAGAGLLLGLAYLTRPEAIGYVLFFAAVFAIYGLIKRDLTSSSLSIRAGVFLLGFVLLATPYLLYLRTETGQWTVSGKTTINTIAAELETDPAESIGGFSPGHVKEFAKYFFLNVLQVQKALPVLLPLFLWPFVGIGLFTESWGRKRIEREVFLIFFCLVTVAGYAAAVVQLRYLYILLPVLIGWTAFGIAGFAKWLQATAGRSDAPVSGLRTSVISAAAVLAIFLYVSPLAFYLRSEEDRWGDIGYEERDAGLWLRQHTNATPYIFSATRWPAFYADAKQLPPSSPEPDAILSEIKSERVDYVVTSERSLKRNPYLSVLDERLRNDPDFVLVYEEVPRKGYRVSIFKQL